ncbi:MAG: aminoglycoside phosphotransferase family protein [Thermoplasmataceae archaeon]
MEREKLQNFLQSIFPEIDLTGSRIDTHGWDSRVLFLQSGRVVKFPLVENPGKLEREYCILKSVKPLLGSLIPERISFVLKKYKGEEYGALSYDAIRGITVDDAGPISRDMEISIWTQMERVLPAIHHHMPPCLSRCGIPSTGRQEWRDFYIRFLQEIKLQVFPILSNRLSDYLESQIMTFVENDENFDFVPRLIHGDIDPRNLLWDSHSLRISGIIDWGDSMIGDPAFDYASMLFNERIGLQLIRNQRELSGCCPERRIEFYHRMVPVYWIIYGLRNKMEKLVSEGIKELETRKRFRIPFL